MRKKILIIGTFLLIFLTIFTFIEPSLRDASKYDYYQGIRILYWGLRGRCKSVQWRLLQWKYYNGKVDGIYGTGPIEQFVNFNVKTGLRKMEW